MKLLVKTLIDAYKEGLKQVDNCVTINEAKDITVNLNIYGGLCSAASSYAAEQDDLEQFTVKLLVEDYPDAGDQHIWRPPIFCSNIVDLKRALEQRLDYLLKILPV